MENTFPLSNLLSAFLAHRNKSTCKKRTCKDIYCCVVHRAKKPEAKCTHKSGMLENLWPRHTVDYYVTIKNH